MSNSLHPHDPYQALRYKNFRLFLVVKLLVTLSLQMQAVIVGWQLYFITNDALSLGLIGLAEALPAIGVSLYAGHIADRVNRKIIVNISYVVLFFASIILLLFSYHQQHFLLQFGTLPIYAAIFITGIARGFSNPANFGLLSQILPKSAYLNSSTWNSSTWHLGAISGPAIGGFLYGFFGATVSYLTIIGLFFCAIIIFNCIQIQQTIQNNNSEESLQERLFSGVRFVFRNPIILSAISLDLFAVLFGGAVALLPIFASDILKTGPEGLGMLRAAPAIGSTITGIFLAYRKPVENAGMTLLFCVAAFGVCTIIFGISTNFYLSLLMLALSGAFDNVSVVIRSTILQMLTPDDMKGRVSAVNSIFVGSSNEIGAFESGITAKWFGTVPAVVFGGVMTLVVVLVTYLKAPVLKKLDLEGL